MAIGPLRLKICDFVPFVYSFSSREVILNLKYLLILNSDLFLIDNKKLYHLKEYKKK